MAAAPPVPCRALAAPREHTCRTCIQNAAKLVQGCIQRILDVIAQERIKEGLLRHLTTQRVRRGLNPADKSQDANIPRMPEDAVREEEAVRIDTQQLNRLHHALLRAVVQAHMTADCAYPSEREWFECTREKPGETTDPSAYAGLMLRASLAKETFLFETLVAGDKIRSEWVKKGMMGPHVETRRAIISAYEQKTMGTEIFAGVARLSDALAHEELVRERILMNVKYHTVGYTDGVSHTPRATASMGETSRPPTVDIAAVMRRCAWHTENFVLCVDLVTVCASMVTPMYESNSAHSVSRAAGSGPATPRPRKPRAKGKKGVAASPLGIVSARGGTGPKIATPLSCMPKRRRGGRGRGTKRRATESLVEPAAKRPRLASPCDYLPPAESDANLVLAGLDLAELDALVDEAMFEPDTESALPQASYHDGGQYDPAAHYAVLPLSVRKAGLLPNVVDASLSRDVMAAIPRGMSAKFVMSHILSYTLACTQDVYKFAEEMPRLCGEIEVLQPRARGPDILAIRKAWTSTMRLHCTQRRAELI